MIVKLKTYATNVKSFESIFSVESELVWTLDEEKRSFIQPLVDKKLMELAKQYDDAVSEKTKLSFIDPERTPTEVNQILQELERAKKQVEETLNQFNIAREPARYFEFEVKEKPEDYLNQD